MIVSPSSSRTMRMTPCMAGCEGPTFSSMLRVSRSDVAASIGSDLLLLVLDLRLQLHQAVEHGLGPRRASRDVEVYGNDGVDPLHGGVVVVEPSRAGAHAECDHPLRLAHLLVHALENRGHLVADGPDDEQDVGLAWREAGEPGAEAVHVVMARGRRHVLHSAAGGHERILEDRVLAGPADGGRELGGEKTRTVARNFSHTPSFRCGVPPESRGELTGRSVYGRSDGASSLTGDVEAAQAELQRAGHAHDGHARENRGLAGKDFLLQARGGAERNLARVTVGVPAEPTHRDRVGPEVLEAAEERTARGHLAFDAVHVKGDEAERTSPGLARSRAFRMGNALRWTAGDQHFRPFSAHIRSHRRASGIILSRTGASRQWYERSSRMAPKCYYPPNRRIFYEHEYLAFFEHHFDEVDPSLEGGRALAQPDLDAPHRESLQDRAGDRAGQRFDQVVLAGVGRGLDPGEDRAVIDRLVEGVGAGRGLEIAPKCDIGLARLREASLARTHADPGPELDTGQGDLILPLTARHRNLP